MKKEVIVVYSGEVYHDFNGVTYRHFIAQEGGVSPDGRLITLPSDLFPLGLGQGDICTITLKKH